MKKQEYDVDAALRRLAAMKDEDIDFSDIPERLNWDGAIRGRDAWLKHLESFRPIKKSTTLRIDADILAWFKSRGPKYQTAMNAALREFMRTHT